MNLERPLLLWDGDCGFCRFWVERWKGVLDGRVDFLPSQELKAIPRGVTREDFQRGVVLLEPKGQVSKGAEAIFRALSYAPGRSWPRSAYEKVPGFAPVAEGVYRVVATNRPFFSKLTKMFLKK